MVQVVDIERDVFFILKRKIKTGNFRFCTYLLCTFAANYSTCKIIKLKISKYDSKK